MMHEVMDRFYEVERVGMVAFEAHGDKVSVYVVVYGDKDDEELRSRLAKIEESIVKDFSNLDLCFCYMSVDEVLGKRKVGQGGVLFVD
jgi:lipoate-protein ligase B